MVVADAPFIVYNQPEGEIWFHDAFVMSRCRKTTKSKSTLFRIIRDVRKCRPRKDKYHTILYHTIPYYTVPHHTYHTAPYDIPRVRVLFRYPSKVPERRQVTFFRSCRVVCCSILAVAVKQAIESADTGEGPDGVKLPVFKGQKEDLDHHLYYGNNVSPIRWGDGMLLKELFD